ncbi:MAG: hypothetical protein IJA80_02550 [Clostridia bacterium]|nr:hypothetical protein [Clostridia bacterium]
MKSVNITTMFVEDDLSNIAEGIVSDRQVFKIKAEKNNNEKSVNLRIVTFLNAMSSNEDPFLENVYDIMWTLGCVKDGEFDNTNIGTTIFDTAKCKIKNEKVSARQFTNERRKLILNHYVIDTLGTYYLKVYIKKANTELPWEIQSINSIEICE